jgi:UDP-glucuronate 4-epimerase
VFASSSSVYGVQESGPFREDLCADAPVSPYAASKRAGEIFCRAAHETWGLNATCVRIFTVYGPRQRPTMAISRFIRQISNGEAVSMYGDGSSERDYTYVGDVVCGLIAAMDKADGFEVVNIGSGQPIRLDALVQEIGRAVGRTPIVEHMPVQVGDVPLTHADISRAHALLGWRPQVSLEEGLRRMVAWNRD